MTNEQPRLLMIAGPNGSGKSSLITSSEMDNKYDSIINPDNYARGLNIPDEYERYTTATCMCSVLRNKLLESKVTFGFETVASRE
jgi:predicted ABC-type ATPase